MFSMLKRILTKETKDAQEVDSLPAIEWPELHLELNTWYDYDGSNRLEPGSPMPDGAKTMVTQYRNGHIGQSHHIHNWGWNIWGDQNDIIRYAFLDEHTTLDYSTTFPIIQKDPA